MLNILYKKCLECNKLFDQNQLVKSKKNKDGYRSLCKNCKKIISNDYYHGVKKPKKNHRAISDKDNLQNKRFGKLLVLNYLCSNKHGNRMWLCLCDCGSLAKVASHNLLKGNTITCGCSKIGKNSDKWKGYCEISGAYWGKILNGAKRRNIIFNITIEYIWSLFLQQNRMCCLSGLPIDFIDTKTTGVKQTASLDRIDSDKGYVEGNVQWVHKDVNKMKSDFTNEKFLDLCKKIYINRGSNDI